MAKFNYQTICQNILLKDLPSRCKEVVVRRFGLKGESETLESIGQSFGVTRERVRQIEEDGMRRLRKKLEDPRCQAVFKYFVHYLKDSGLLKREDLLLSQVAEPKFRNHAFFLLTLGQPFQRFKETEDLYTFWSIDKNILNTTKRVISGFLAELKRKNRPLPLTSRISPSYVEISKSILRGPNGLYGLRNWPEVNPRGIKDRAYLVIKKESRPLHFSRVSQLLGKGTLTQTVHNELIKDPRFVLVGRGLYALQEWGYEPGIVREVISKVLEEARRPMDRAEVVKKVLKQRKVKSNTISLNLQSKKYFIKNSEGKYTLRKA